MGTPICVFEISSLVTPALATDRPAQIRSRFEFEIQLLRQGSSLGDYDLQSLLAASGPDHDDCKDQEHQLIKNAREAAAFTLENEAADQRRTQDRHNTGLRAAVPKCGAIADSANAANK